MARRPGSWPLTGRCCAASSRPSAPKSCGRSHVSSACMPGQPWAIFAALRLGRAVEHFLFPGEYFPSSLGCCTGNQTFPARGVIYR